MTLNTKMLVFMDFFPVIFGCETPFKNKLRQIHYR